MMGGRNHDPSTHRVTGPALDALARPLLDSLGRDLLGASLVDLGWTVGFDRARTRLGVCRPRTKRITISAHLARTLPRAVVEDTLRHEIAHAIDVEAHPNRRGRKPHDAVWQTLAVRCGANPSRLYDGPLPDDPLAPFGAACPACGASQPLYREPLHARRCRLCAQAGERVFMRVTRRADGHVIWTGGSTPGAYGGAAGVAASCPGCGDSFRRARRPRRPTACARCCRRHAGGRYDDRYRLRYR